MRRFINIVCEEFSQVIHPHELITLVRKIHHNEHDFDEGDLEHRIWKFKFYKLETLSVSNLNVPWAIDDILVDDYIAQLHRGESAPPIIYDMVDNVVIDGSHRIAAAKAIGIKHISAYVGSEVDKNWSEDDWSEDDH